MLESAKDRWNENIENAVRWAQTKDWIRLRDDLEGRVADLLSKGMSEGRAGLQASAREGHILKEMAIDQGKGIIADAEKGIKG